MSFDFLTLMVIQKININIPTFLDNFKEDSQVTNITPMCDSKVSFLLFIVSWISIVANYPKLSDKSADNDDLK